MSKTVCHVDRPHYAFGLCRPCYSKKWRAAHPGYGEAHYQRTREKQLARGRERYFANRETRLAQCKRYRQTHPEILKNSQLKSRYGITLKEYQDLLKKQCNSCAVCGETPIKRPVVEHNHSTGQIRGVVCTRCNIAIGAFESYASLFSAISDYLKMEAYEKRA